jgi:hypothetical protein
LPAHLRLNQGMHAGSSTRACVLCVVNHVLHFEINHVSSYPTQKHCIRHYTSHCECAAAIYLGREGPYPEAYPVSRAPRIRRCASREGRPRCVSHAQYKIFEASVRLLGQAFHLVRWKNQPAHLQMCSFLICAGRPTRLIKYT